ncbi:MAG: ATP-binding protein [Spirochaetaceae bacterium]
MIVEDEAIVAMDIRHRLEKLGYVVVRSVASGEEAVVVAADLEPDIVLMDIQLQGSMDGIEAAGLIRERDGTPVVFLTAYSDRDSLERAKVADAFGYLLKPFEERELGIAIEMALYKEQMQRRLSESREWLHGTVAALHEGVITTDEDGTILFVNRRAEELIGWSEAEARGLDVEVVVRTEPIPPAEFATEVLPGAVRLLRRDGSVAYVELRTREIPKPAKGRQAPSQADASPPAVCGRVVVLREVSDILRYDHAMRTARAEAEAALKSKSEFLANVTHELRTPLNSILGMTELAHDLARDGRQREYLGILKSAAENLHGLISSILDLSRIDSGHLKLELTDVDLGQVLKSVVESFALEVQQKGLALHFAQSPALPAYVRADRVRLVQVLSNLIANAVKYTESGSITVLADSAEGSGAGAARMIRISVSDTGPGIPESEQQRIFEPFTQIDGGPTRAHSGAGIGLAVAREIAELMGGRILLDSVEGEGSVFTAELPLDPAERPRATREDQTAPPSSFPRGRSDPDTATHGGADRAFGLLKRFSPDALDRDQLPELAAVATELRGRAADPGADAGAQVDEVLFRISLAARRGDLEAACRRLSELGQMRWNEYNDER